MDSAVLAAGLCGRLWASVRPLWASVALCGLWELPGTSGNSFLRLGHLYQEATFHFVETAVLNIFLALVVGMLSGRSNLRQFRISCDFDKFNILK